METPRVLVSIVCTRCRTPSKLDLGSLPPPAIVNFARGNQHRGLLHCDTCNRATRFVREFPTTPGSTLNRILNPLQRAYYQMAARYFIYDGYDGDGDDEDTGWQDAVIWDMDDTSDDEATDHVSTPDTFC